MKKIYLLLIATLTALSSIFAQADCSSAVIICGNTQPFNPSGIGSKLEQLACGGIEHNSIWLAFQAKASGKLNFAVRAFTLAGLPTTADFDWSLYSIPGTPNTGNCDAKTQISCNFSGTATVFGIPGTTGMATPNYTSAAFNPGVDVVNGNWYLLLVDQFSNTTPLLFSVQFTGNPESPYINSTPAIFDNRPDFTITNTGGCNGAYNFTNSSVATGGIASYAWDFGDGSTSAAINPTHTYVTPGTYYVTLTVTDNNGCKSDIRKTITYNNTPPTVNAAGLLILPACSDINNGSITITTIGATTPGVTGGTPPYTFELVSPSPMTRPSQSSNIFTGLQPGGYFIKVTDACGKSAVNTTVATVTQLITNSTVGLGIQNIQSSCAGTPSGSATIFANGTVPPYTMQLVNSSPVTTGVLPSIQRDPVTSTYFTTFTGLLPGVYTVEAIDGCGKVRRATFTVTASTAPTVGVVNSASCTGSATGTINITATAATGLTTSGAPGTFQYALIAPSPITRPFQNSSIFENLLPGSYTVAVRDICGNIGTATSTINAAVAPTFGTAFTTLSCPNGATGTIEVQVSAVGGGSTHTFELIAPSPVVRPAQVSNAFENLPPGVYTIRMTDGCGTQNTSNVTVGASTAATFTTTIGASCSATASGTILVAPGASTIGPYTFELIGPGAAIRPPQGSNVANTFNSIFTGLNQGGYTIRMTDGCGVPATNTATITAPTALAFPTGSTTTPSCTAGSTGQIIVAQPTTGLAAYKYELIAPSPVTVAPQYSRIFNGLPAGNYTIRITDSCGTQVAIGAPITVAAAAAPTLSVTNTSSCAISSGTITALATTANQGGGTYLYALIAPSPVTRPNQASPIFTGLSAGDYTVQITDQCGATGTTTTTINIAGAFAPSAGGSVVSCNGSSYNAQIIVTNPQNYTPGGPIPPGSGGGPFTFALYDATNTTLLAGPQASNLFTTVIPVAGNPSHTVRVTDICGNTSTAIVTVNMPTPVSNATITASTASCAASNTGIIRVTTQAAGGFAPYSYTLIDANTSAIVAGPQTNIVFNNVPASATGYFVRSTDACGNSITNTVALLFPAAAAPTATVVTTASCASPSTGRIVVTPGTGATMAGGTFSYALYDAANVVLISGPQASPVFNNVAPGTYTVRIIDRCGTVGTVSATIASGVAAATATGVASGTCTGGSSGVITGGSTGGSLPITYTLVDLGTGTVVTGPQSSNIFTGLPAGTYTVRVIDACGTVTNSTDVVVGNLTTIPTISTTTALDCSGFAVLSGYGGSGNGGPYTYALCAGAGCNTFGSFTTTSTFTIITNGTYRIAVQDRCGNQTISADVAITIPIKPVITGFSKNTNCGPTTINLTFTGIANTVNFSLDGANFSPTLGIVGLGAHTIRIANNNAGTFGCASDVFSFFIGTNPTVTNPTVTTGAVGVPFSQTFTQSGGEAPVNFTTTSTLPAGITLATNGLLSGTPTVGGTFNIVVTATDANGCVGTGTTYTLVIPSGIITSGTLTPFTACTGTVSTEQSFIVSGTGLTANLDVTAPAGFEVSLSSGGGFSTSVSMTPVSGNVANTTIYVRMSAIASGAPSGNIVSSSAPYSANVAVSGTVTPNNIITLTSLAGTDAQTVCINTAITNIMYSTSGATGATFSGLPAGITGNWAANVVTISGSPTTTVGSPFSYTVTLTGGCGTVTATGTITVTPNNTITLTSLTGTDAQTVCINTAITNIMYSTSGATGATFSGLPAGVTGNWAANVVTISGSPTTTVGSPFSYTVT